MNSPYSVDGSEQWWHYHVTLWLHYLCVNNGEQLEGKYYDYLPCNLIYWHYIRSETTLRPTIITIIKK
jgi:hypothetical protein